jgi:hypothetical protein
VAFASALLRGMGWGGGSGKGLQIRLWGSRNGTFVFSRAGMRLKGSDGSLVFCFMAV